MPAALPALRSPCFLPGLSLNLEPGGLKGEEGHLRGGGACTPVQESLLAFTARLRCATWVDRTTSSQGLMRVFPRWMLVCSLSCCTGSLNYILLLSVLTPGQLVRTEEFETELAYAKYSRRAGYVIHQNTGNDALLYLHP